MSVKFIQIEPNTTCNFGCEFCSGRHMPQGNMSLSNFKKIIDSLPDLERLHLQGEGEPLMNPDFWDMVKIARSRNVEVSFITNGSMLTADNVAKIVQHKIRFIQVSIESPDPTDFKSIRKGSLRLVKNGLERLMKSAVDNKSALKVGLAVLVLNRTLDQLPKILKFYRGLGLNGGMSFCSLSDREAYLRIYPPHIRAEIVIHEQMQKYLSRVRASLKAEEFCTFSAELLAIKSQNLYSCPWLESGLFVNFKGEVTACCSVKDVSKYGLGTAADMVQTLS